MMLFLFFYIHYGSYRIEILVSEKGKKKYKNFLKKNFLKKKLRND